MKRSSLSQKSDSVLDLSCGKRIHLAQNYALTQDRPFEIADYHEVRQDELQVPQIPSQNSAFVEPKRTSIGSVKNNPEVCFNIKGEFEEYDVIKCDTCLDTTLSTNDRITESTEMLLESKESQIISLKEMVDSKEKMIFKLREQLVQSLADKSELEFSNLDQMSQLDTEVYKLSAENVILKKSIEMERNSWHSLKDKFDQLDRMSKVRPNLDPNYVKELEEKLKYLTKQNDDFKLTIQQNKLELEKVQFLKGKYEKLKQIYSSNLTIVNSLEREVKHLIEKMVKMKSENESLNLKLAEENENKVMESNCVYEQMNSEINKMKNENQILNYCVQVERDTWKLLVVKLQQSYQENINLKQSFDDQTTKLQQSYQENVDLKKSFEDQSAKLQQSNQENLNLKQSFDDTSAKLQQSNQENVNLKKSFDGQSAKLQQSYQENVNLKKSFEEESVKFQQSNQENVAKLSNEIEQLKMRIAKMQKSNQRTINQLSTNNHDHCQMLGKVHDDVAHLNQLLNTLSEENANLKAMYRRTLQNKEETIERQFMYGN